MNMLRDRIVFISSADSQPRYHRRVEAFLSGGYAVSVYTFSRGYYRVNVYPEEAQVTSLGALNDGRYLQRIPQLLKAIRAIRKKEVKEFAEPQIIYAFGVDSAFLALAIRRGNARVVYEVGDLRALDQRSSFVGLAAAAAERYVLRQASALVVTSPEFLHKHYARVAPGIEKRSAVIENRLSQRAGLGPRPKRNIHRPRRIRVGFAGLLRYPQTLLPLLEALARRDDRFVGIVYGDGPLRAEVEGLASRATNITYRGAFRNPHDLQGIYEDLHLNLVVYDNRDPNVRLALPNKLYESLFFGVPLVVASNTALANHVTKMRVGFVVDPSKETFADEFFDHLTLDSVLEAADYATMVPTHLLIDNPRRIVQAIETISKVR